MRVRACGVSFVDLLLARGDYQVRPPLPLILGSEFSGVVDAVGSGPEPSIQPGDAVCGVRQGAWAEFVCLPAQRAHRLADPERGAEAAVVCSAYSTALYALRDRGRLRAGETLLVLGAAGAVGHAAVQLGRAMGARVIAGASSAPKRAAAANAGAHETFDSGSGWKDTVKTLAGPGGVDVCFDPVGGAATDTAFRTLGWDGRHLMIGFAGGEIGSLKTNLPIVKGATMVGVDLRQFGQKFPDRAVALQRECVDLFDQRRIQPNLRAVLPVAHFDEAAQMAQERGGCGRVLFTF